MDVGIIGFGAFGQLVARHLHPYFRICAYDPASGLEGAANRYNVALTTLELAAGCAIVVIACPVKSMQAVIDAISPLVRPGALVLDVGSVKVHPAELMRTRLPEHVEVIATHPLFGPQSARDGIEGLKIAICPIRGRSFSRIAAFLRKRLGLNVIMTTPDDHDREAAMVQGLTHLIAKVLVQMEPMPVRMTTKSFELLTSAIEMVRNDAPAVFEAIERDNPYAKSVRMRFFGLAHDLSRELDGQEVSRVALPD